MYLRRCYKTEGFKRHAYWALVESIRTLRGPRQRVVAYLGQLEKEVRLGVQRAAEGKPGFQGNLFDETRPQWVEIDASRMRLEGCKDLGGAFLGLELMNRLGLMEFFAGHMPQGREDVPWSAMSSARRFWASTAMNRIIPSAALPGLPSCWRSSRSGRVMTWSLISRCSPPAH